MNKKKLVTVSIVIIGIGSILYSQKDLIKVKIAEEFNKPLICYSGFKGYKINPHTYTIEEGKVYIHSNGKTFKPKYCSVMN